MQGVMTIGGTRYPTKKAFKIAVAERPARVRLEATSIMGNEYDGLVSEAPAGRYYIVGPCPYTKRSWYAAVDVRVDGTIKVS